MRKYSLALLWLQLRLIFIRFGSINVAVLMLGALSIAAWQWGIPQLRIELETAQQSLARAKHALAAADGPEPVVQRPESEERLAAFYDTLGEKHYVEQQVKTLFAIAEQTELTLSQAEYKSAFDKSGRYHTYQVQLPVKGSYKAIREFCQKILLAIPFASLDEMNFKRESIASPMLEANLRFTLYLNDASLLGDAKETIGTKGHFE